MEKINLYPHCIGYGFKKFATINEEERIDWLKDLI